MCSPHHQSTTWLLPRSRLHDSLGANSRLIISAFRVDAIVVFYQGMWCRTVGGLKKNRAANLPARHIVPADTPYAHTRKQGTQRRLEVVLKLLNYSCSSVSAPSTVLSRFFVLVALPLSLPMSSNSLSSFAMSVSISVGSVLMTSRILLA
jgi:hypothetical protein